MVQSDATNKPEVSIVIACLNEAHHIRACLDSILEQDFPQQKMEVLIVDGMSCDATRQIIADNYSRHSFIRILDNPQRITPAAFNTGIQAAAGDVILIMGAHSIYEKDYIAKCVKYLMESDAANVGGVCKVLPGSNTLVAKSIAYTLCSPFGMGNSYYRVGSKTNRYVDTVFGGCYKKEVFEKIGLFDTELVRGQDTEFNARLIKSGGKILLVPGIISYYTARPTYIKQWKMQWQYGKLKPLVIKKVGKFFTLRQVVAPFFVLLLTCLLTLSLLSSVFFLFFWGLIIFYLSVNLFFSTKIALKKNIKCLWFIPLAFAIIHFAWGIGFLKGVWDFMLFNKEKTKHRSLKNIPLTR